MTESEFLRHQEALQHRILRYEEHDRERPEKLFFIFSSQEERDRALKLLDDPNTRGYTEALRYLQRYTSDPARADVGLEMDFMKHPKGLRESVERFFKDNGLAVNEEYEVVEEVPEKTPPPEEEEALA